MSLLDELEKNVYRLIEIHRRLSGRNKEHTFTARAAESEQTPAVSASRDVAATTSQRTTAQSIGEKTPGGNSVFAIPHPVTDKKAFDLNP